MKDPSGLDLIVAFLGMLGALLLLVAAFTAAAQERPQTTDRLIVRLADWAEGDRAQPMGADRARSLSAAARTRINPLRRMSGGAQVVRLTHPMALADVEGVARNLMADPTVLHAEPDRRKFPLRVPTDPLFRNQWNLFELAGGIDAPAAWDITTGSPAVVVAVIDSGVRTLNADLAGRLAPGYDFIREDAPGLSTTANDGDGRDADPSDPGNWISAEEAGRPPFTGCPEAEASTWHGTHIAGIIASSANNAYGVAGIAWEVRVLPARVLGKCGGYTSDIIDAARWTAGLAVPGVPANANPAQVVNLSLGAPGACSVEEQRAVDDVLATGATKAVVSASGNDGGDATRIAPGNCRGVIAVTATDRFGARAPYASIGANVALAAPGGAFPASATSGENGILSLFNAGRTGPAADAFAFAVGTSEAAAHVSGVAALVLSVNPGLTAAELRALLLRTARAFPNVSCTPLTCGAGIVNAAAAVLAAAAAAPPPAPAAPAPAPTAPPPPAMTADMTIAAPGAAAAEGASGGGGGGCTFARDGAPEVALPLALIWAIAMILARRRDARTLDLPSRA
ncbi:MAG: S8 family peptidase [Burkholderiales bacterium]